MVMVVLYGGQEKKLATVAEETITS